MEWHVETTCIRTLYCAKVFKSISIHQESGHRCLQLDHYNHQADTPGAVVPYPQSYTDSLPYHKLESAEIRRQFLWNFDVYPKNN